ncbi:MAG: translesion error-prone DNA polymerase V autoproteolytic subunit [Candidatus Acinetobacter avistercoris]|nr:translesion error-prone DNA polymerase V autoproteolytic subunit [Candidatus Acinetobacter avistercoris]
MEVKNTYGGKREGAGRKAIYDEPTTVMRVPKSKVIDIKDFLKSDDRTSDVSDFKLVDPVTKASIPLATERVKAGFPSPAQDYIDKNIDLNEFLITNHNSTFMVRVDSLSMLNAGLDVGDYLVVDRSLEPQHRDIVIACIDNDYFTVKRLINDVLGSWLKAENEGYEDIHPAEGQQFEIWGVVTNVIKKFR